MKRLSDFARSRIQSRRELLKHFGVGTVIAPVGAMAAGRLIEVPKVEPVELSGGIPAELDMGAVHSAKLTLRLDDGSVRVLNIDGLYGFGSGKPIDKVTINFYSAADPYASPEVRQAVGQLESYEVTMDAPLGR